MREPRDLRVLVVGDAFSFPDGEGATARVHAVARGLSAAGCHVKILVTRPSERPSSRSSNRDASGAVGGVPFEYTSGTTFLSRSFWGRRGAEAKGVFRASLFAAQGCDAVVVYTTSSAFLPLALRMSARLGGAVVVKDASELPFVYESDTRLRRRYHRWHVAVVQRAYDGTIVISTYLDEYFKRVSRRGAVNLLVPILVDVEEYARASSATAPEPGRVLYAGSLGHVGELETLLRVFAGVVSRRRDARLTILGNHVGTARRDDLERTAKALGVDGIVEFAGLIPRCDMPDRLARASVLVLTRAAGAFSTAGLPTKLAEYLATGRPVVVTAVGDIPRYLRDGQDAFLVPPGDEEAFRSRLEYVLDHPEAAAAVGLQGRDLARREFDYRIHGPRIARFLADLRSRRAGQVDMMGGSH